MKNKTYRWVLGLFLLFFYGVLITFCIFNVKRNFGSIKESYLREHYFLVNSITKDLIALEDRKFKIQRAIEICYNEYEKQYKYQGIGLQFYKGSECLYSDMQQGVSMDLRTIEKNKKITHAWIVNVEGKKYLCVAGYLPEQYSEYALVYYKDVTEMIKEWMKQIAYLFGASTVFAGILSIALMILLDYLFRPLEQISATSKKIAAGEYQEKLDIKGEGEIAEVVLSFNTMSEKIRAQMQSLQDYAEEKQRLIDNLAHELRTPLTAIYGYAEYMQKTHLEEEDKYVSTQFILQESRRLRSISEILLDLASLREETGLEMKRIEVGGLFERLYQIESLKFKEKEIKFNYQNELATIYGNEDLLEGMLINIVDNAIKACESRKGKITLRGYEKQGYQIIEVKDNGKGMTQEQLSHVTEAFYRVDKARSRKDGGNGLGLALCEEIAKKHHARLEFDSKPNEGTRVNILFEKTDS